MMDNFILSNIYPLHVVLSSIRKLQEIVTSRQTCTRKK